MYRCKYSHYNILCAQMCRCKNSHTVDEEDVKKKDDAFTKAGYAEKIKKLSPLNKH